MKCDLPPKGWKCNGESGHQGPCAAWPNTLWLRIKWALFMNSTDILFRNHKDCKKDSDVSNMSKIKNM